MKEKAEMDSKGLKVYFDKYERCIVGFHSSLSVSIPQVEVYHHCLVVGIIVCQQTPFDKSVRLILMMLRVCVCVCVCVCDFFLLEGKQTSDNYLRCGT